jgi:hypothetical protein
VNSGYPWFERGGYSGYALGAGVFAAYYNGSSVTVISFRASLVGF